MSERAGGAVSLRDGVVGYVVKPFSRTLLLGAVADGARSHGAELEAAHNAGPASRAQA